jgi:cation diffusion facilitator CzcD-associated flavoprotein CzcO
MGEVQETTESGATGVGDEDSPTSFDAIVVGAGFAGIYMLHQLRKLGLSARLLEAGDDVGGTWYWNRYPGARCDSDSLYYSFSFDDELDQDFTWRERFAVQPQMMEYLTHVADRFDLRRDMQFGTYVTSLTFDDATSRWTVGTRAGEEFTAKYCITAMGCLSLAYTPDFKGLDTFQGIWHHTGQWPHEDVDFTGKRVAVVGTGASGVQAIPIIAKAADHLVVFQRTPNYAIPAQNHPWDPDFMAEYKSEYPTMRAKGRTTENGRPNNPQPRDLAADSLEVREQVLEAAWAHGGIEFIYTYTRGADLMQVLGDFIRSKIDELVDDPDVATLLKPTTHPLGAKRPPLETDYYVTYNRDNVKLVDVNATPIEEITPTGIRTSDAEYDVDIIVLATGFDAVTGPLLDLDVRGRDGRRLTDKWAEGPRTYLGIGVEGFPNLFTLTGPGSPNILSGVVPVAIEQHVEFVTDCIAHLEANDIERIEVTAKAEDEWSELVAEVGLNRTHHLTNSWYVGANIPGKPRVLLAYTGGINTFRLRCNEEAENGYEGFELTPSSEKTPTSA